MGAIDYWCNAFTPDLRAVWEATIAAQGISLPIRTDSEDGFADPDGMCGRMDELGFEALLLPSADVPEHAGPSDYERFATLPDAVAALSVSHPGRFAGLFTIDPTRGMSGVTRAAQVLQQDCFVGLHLHTHSWDRAFDHRDLYPFYALAADLGVPFVMQAGASGGLMASECGRPIGIDRPALFFGGVRFVLSHTGWPWVDEAIAMAQKHPNVYLGTAAWPPNRWSPELVRFARGAGRGKILFGTGFPIVGHQQALERLPMLELGEEARQQLLEGAARTVFARLRGLGRSRTGTE